MAMRYSTSARPQLTDRRSTRPQLIDLGVETMGRLPQFTDEQLSDPQFTLPELTEPQLTDPQFTLLRLPKP
jgi:hypothetical protein